MYPQSNPIKMIRKVCGDAAVSMLKQSGAWNMVYEFADVTHENNLPELLLQLPRN